MSKNCQYSQTSFPGAIYMKIFTSLLLSIFCISAAYSADPLEKRILSNGMTLITQEDHSRDIIALLTYVDGGNRTETPELSGLSHYFEHLIFRGGTDKQAELEMRKKFKALGTFYGYTFEDGTCYYIVVPSANLPDALDRYCDVMLNLKITEARTEVERGIVLEEFSQSYFDIPGGMTYYNLYQTAFTQHPYGMTTIGDTGAVKAATMETFQKFYDERYTPDQLVTAAVGNFETEELLAEIEKTFGQHSAGNRSFESGIIEPPQTEFRQVNHFMPISSVHFAAGFHIMPYSSPEYPALEVLNHFLADYPAGILNSRLSQEKGLFSYIYSWMDKTKDPGLWLIGGELQPEKLDEGMTSFFETIADVIEKELTEARISSAQGELIRAYKENRESFMRRAESYAFYELASNLSLEGLYEERIKSVTIDDIKALAKRILKAENTTLSLVLPENTEPPEGNRWAAGLTVQTADIAAESGGWQPVQEFTLRNGAVLLLQKDESSTMASLEIIVRGGLWAEPAGKEGIAEFLCRLQTRGTLEFDGEYFSSILGKYGIALTAGNEGDYSRISVNSTAEAFTKAVEMGMFALTRTGFRDEDIESVRNEMLTEIKSIPDRTYDYTRQEFDHLLYQNSVYQRSILGTDVSIKSIDKFDLETYMKELYCGGNIIITVTGNFSKSKVVTLLTELGGEIDAGDIFQYNVAKEPPAKKKNVKIIDKDRAQTTYNMGWTIPPATSEHYLPLTFAQKMLGSTMFFRFVYKEGICYRMWTRNTENIGYGKFWFETGISPNNYNFSQTEVLQEFSDYLNEKITEEVLSDAKAECIQTLLLVNETTGARASWIGKHYLLGYGPDYLFRYPHLVNSATAKDVRKAVKKYLKPDGYTLLVVGKVE